MPRGGLPGRPPPAASREDALYFAGKRVFVFAPEAGMKRLLTFLSGTKIKGPLDESIRLAGSRDHHLIGGVNLPSSLRHKAKAEIPGPFQEFAGAMDFQSATFLAAFGETSWIEIVAHYPSEGQAREARKQLDALRSLAEKGLAALEPPLRDGAGEALRGLLIEQQGAAVTIKLKVGEKALAGFSLHPPEKARRPAAPPGKP
jgi:hypothetical protein